MKAARYTLVLVLHVVMLSACASPKAPFPETEPPSAFPEVRRIVFLDNKKFGSARLRNAMATQQRPLLSPWKRGSDYNPATVDDDLLRLQKYYFDRGYLDVRATLVKVEQNEANNTVQLHIRIEEGEVTVVREVEVKVQDPAPPELPPVETLRNDLPLRVDKPITKAAFDASRAGLLLALQRAGYARARVHPRTEVDRETHEAFLTYTLESGERTAFGRVAIQGAENVTVKAIRRRLTFQPGQIYSPTELTDSQAAIYDLGMFRTVTHRSLNLEATDAPLDLEFEVSERKPRSFEIGLGLSTVEQFRLQAKWTFRNVFGGAEHLSLAGKISSPGLAFETRFHLPHFVTRRARFTQTVFVDSQKEINTDPLGLTDRILEIEDAQPAFDVLRYGGESRVDHQFTKAFGGSAGIELSVNAFSNVDPDAIRGLDPEVARDHFLFTQFAELTWNTSNSAINATRGFIALLRTEHSATGLLSEFDFVKASIEGRHYLPLWGRVTFAARLKLGFLQLYGDSEVAPFNVRFFAGGPGSIRGFAVNRVGPLTDGNAPLGGRSLIEGSAELRFPFIGDLGGVLFVDFGQVFEPSLVYHLDQLRYAVGPGIRYDTPIGPLRFDVGFITDRRPDEPFGRVELSIIQAF
jgi:outer membrane protein assembly complex protein YaeT